MKTNNTKLSLYGQWLASNKDRIIEAQRSAAADWLKIPLAEFKTTCTWQYLPNPRTGKQDQKQGYRACVDHTGYTPKLRVTHSRFGRMSRTFDGSHVVKAMWAEFKKCLGNSREKVGHA